MWTDFMSVHKYNRNPVFHKNRVSVWRRRQDSDIIPIREPANLNKNTPFARGVLLAERAGFGYHPLTGAREPE
jgi:hypothetical protein